MVEHYLSSPAHRRGQGVHHTGVRPFHGIECRLHTVSPGDINRTYNPLIVEQVFHASPQKFSPRVRGQLGGNLLRAVNIAPLAQCHTLLT
jgi:hypothetical protein